MSFGEIFNPGLRHLREEKERQKMQVSKPTPGGGAPFGIDLEAGVAKITLRRPPAEQDPVEAPPADAAAPGPDERERDATEPVAPVTEDGEPPVG